MFHRSLATTVVLFVLLIGTLSVGARSAPAAEAPFAQHVPAGTSLAIFSTDVAQTCAAFQKTRLGEKLCGDEFASLVKELKRSDEASGLYLRPVFGLDWSDLAQVHDPGGLMFFPLADGTLGSAWLFLSTEATAAAPPPCLVAAARYFKQHGYRETSVKRAGGTVTVFQPARNDKASSALDKPSPRATFVAAGFYGVANSQAAADALLTVASNNTLATNAVYTELTSGTAEEPANAADVIFYMRPIEFLEQSERSRNQATPADRTKAPANTSKVKSEQKRSGVETARRLGWDGVQAVVGRLAFQVDVCEWQISARVKAPRPYRAALRMLELRPGPLPELPTWVTANITSAATLRWDFPQAIKGFGNFFDEANEPGPDGEGLFEDMLDGLRDDPEGVRVDLRRDLFEKLAPDVISLSDEGPRAPDSGRDPRRWVYAMRVLDMPTVLDALTRFYKNDERVTHEHRGDFDVWTVGPGASLFVEGESDSLVNVRALALGKNQLIFGTDFEVLKPAIEPADAQAAAPLAADADWSRLLKWTARHTGERTALLSLARLDRTLEPSYQVATTKKAPPAVAPPTKNKPGQKAAAKKPKKEPPESEPLLARLWRVLLFGSAEAEHDLPYAAAPKFDRLQSALPHAGIVVTQTDDGWEIRCGAFDAHAVK